MRSRLLNRWWVKAAAQGILAAAPGATRLDDRLRVRVRPPRLTQDYFLSKWLHVQRHLAAIDGAEGQPLPEPVVLELGTGWFPVVPLGLALHGAAVITIDRSRHLEPAQVRATLQLLSDLAAAERIHTAAPHRLARLREMLADPAPRTTAGLLEPLGVAPRIADAQDLSGIPEAAGADLLVSNNTLEHIPTPVLAGIFAEFRQRASPQARMSHYIDLADHYAGFDPRITEFHFLTLSPAQWRLANNRLGYQNRLQLSDYTRLLKQTGWSIARQKVTARKPAKLAGLALVPPYDAMDVQDLLVVKAHLVTERT